MNLNLRAGICSNGNGDKISPITSSKTVYSDNGETVYEQINELKSDVLTKTNTTSYTPSSNYHPATKKYVDDQISTRATTSSVNSKANKTDVLTKTNTTSYTPSSNYHPATKKYVDDKVNNLNISSITSNISNLETNKANKTDVLTKTNTTSYTPSSNYHPATKKYVDDQISTRATTSSVNSKANKTDVLTKTNTTSYTPSSNYHPATKKYVDDKVNNIDIVKTCRFVIGTSKSGWTGKDCDYLCDGVDDQVEINAAIQALPETGGEIKVLDGTYNITASILIDKERVTFCGCGQSTIFKRMWNKYDSGVITCSKSYCTFKDFEIDGNKSVYGETGGGLYLTEENMTDILVKNVFSNNNKTYGINFRSVTNSTVTGNTCNNNRSGIRVNLTSNIVIITGNTCNNNESIGIDIGTALATNIIITGNTCNNNDEGIDIYGTTNSTVTGNICNNNGSTGIYLAIAKNCTVTGNTCNNNESYGIYSSYSKRATITGNNCTRGEGISSDYTSSQYTIYSTDTTNCLIVGNNCSGKAPTTSGTGNIIENNKY